MPNQNESFDTTEAIGRIFFAASIFAFGIQQFIYKGFIQGLEILPEWIPGHAFWSYLTGVALMVTAIGILIRRSSLLSAAILAVIFALCLILLHGPRLPAIYADGAERTRAFETLAMCSGALFLLGTSSLSHQVPRYSRTAIQLGRFFFAASLFVFGLNHFLFARFVASLIPAWIPAHLFWVLFTGLAFVAAAASVAFLWWPRFFSNAIGLMLLLWVFTLHLPRVAAHLRNGDEWNSAFVALGISGVAFFSVRALTRLSIEPAPESV